MEVPSVYRQTVFISEHDFTLCCRWKSAGWGGFLVLLPILSSIAVSVVTISCWDSPVLDEACFLARKRQMPLSSCAPGDGPGPRAPRWNTGRHTEWLCIVNICTSTTGSLTHNQRLGLGRVSTYTLLLCLSWIFRYLFFLLTFLKQAHYFCFKAFEESYYYTSLKASKYQTDLNLNTWKAVMFVLVLSVLIWLKWR